MEDVISLNEAASITALAHTTLRKMCQRGEIQGAVKVARNWCIPRAWAEEHRAEDYTDTHIPLPNAANLARITRQGLIDKIKSGEVKGFAQPLVVRNRWWVERKAFFVWLKGWMEAHRDGKGLLPLEPLPEEREMYTFHDFCVDRGILAAGAPLRDFRVMWDMYSEKYKEYCRAEGLEAERF